MLYGPTTLHAPIVEILYAVSRDDNTATMLASQVLLLQKLLATIQFSITSTSDGEMAADDELGKRCALTLVNLSKSAAHRQLLSCFESTIANLAASTQHPVLSPILFNLLTNLNG